MNSAFPGREPRSDAERLAAMGLTTEIFETAGRVHLADYFSCTEHDPPIFPPIAGWAGGNRSLRDQLVPAWTAINERNQPLVVNDAGTIAITALSGDEKTGTDETPSTRSPKGRVTAEAVEVNLEQQTQFAFMENPAAVMEASERLGRTLWIFLTHRDFERGELRSELSRPLEMSEDGYIDRWGDRIIFPPIPFDGYGDTDNPENPHTGNDDGGQSPEITVEIRKR
ncbi:MAG: hypothetical protein WAM98_10785 [Terriglobales bacterium]